MLPRARQSIEVQTLANKYRAYNAEIIDARGMPANARGSQERIYAETLAARN